MRNHSSRTKHPLKALARLPRRFVVFTLALLLLCWPLPGSTRADAGDLDLTFGDDGKVLIDFFGSVDFGNAVAIQPNGKIVAAGFTFGPKSTDFALARYADTNFDICIRGDGDGSLFQFNSISGDYIFTDGHCGKQRRHNHFTTQRTRPPSIS